MRVLSLDIGGANTKKMVVEFADDGEEVLANKVLYYPMWQGKEGLEEFLEGEKEEADRVGITMTAEEADCFESKSEGVEFIVSVCDRVFDDPLYLTTGGDLVPSKGIREPLDISAANWVASAIDLQSRYGEGLLVDMGSTTTDIIPFGDGPITRTSDLERLKEGQLVYTGFLRTPVGGILKKVTMDGKEVGISPELFAQTADIYNVLGLLEDYWCDTPDGGLTTVKASMKRIARHLCADVEELGEEVIKDICRQVMQEQVGDVAEAIVRVHRGGRVYCCGAGKAVVLEAAKKVGLEAVDLSRNIPAYDNLPCYGLAHMVRDHEGR